MSNRPGTWTRWINPGRPLQPTKSGLAANGRAPARPQARAGRPNRSQGACGPRAIPLQGAKESAPERRERVWARQRAPAANGPAACGGRAP